MKLEIKPAPRSNPEGSPELPWNIWKDGVNTNVKPNKREAEEALEKLRRRFRPVVEDSEEDFEEKDPLTVRRPNGCPKIGQKIRFQHGNRQQEAVVSDYLSTQFLVEWDDPKYDVRAAVIRIDGEYEVL